MAFTKKEIKELFDGQQVSDILPYNSIDADPTIQQEIAQGNGHISISGVQPKFSMVVDNGVLRLVRPEEQGTFILKPAPTALFILDRAYCPANEHLTMQLAQQVYGIETAACALCKFGNGQEAYLTKRFDITSNGGKFPQEDFASVAGLNKKNAGKDYKYDALSYEDCADLIRAHAKAAPVEILKFFRLVVFNYLVLNDDAHLKNFSFIQHKKGDVTLTPAYDLMNTSLHLSMPTIFALKKGLYKEGMVIDDTHSVSRASFMEFGKRIGLSEPLLNRELNKFAKEHPLAEQLINQSHLPQALKKHYSDSYHYRLTTLTDTL